MTDRDPLWSELEALGAEEPSTDAPQAAPEPEVGLSETARQLDGEGYFDDLARRHGAERQQRERAVVDRSADGGLIERLARSAFDPQEWKEIPKQVPGGAISFGGSILQAPDVAAARLQHNAAGFGRRQIEILDRIDRGEAVPDMDDPTGYQHMSPEQRATVRSDAIQARDAFNPTPIQDRTLFRAGEAVQRFGRELIPAAPGYEDGWGAQVGQGLGSLVAGLPFGIMGRLPAAGAFGSAGVGEATQRAVQFDRAERAAGREGLSQEQIIAAGLLGVAPGLTDLAPIEIMLGRLKVPGMTPQVAKSLAGAVGQVGGRVFFQAAIEGGQEAFQQFLQNVIAWTKYNPDQPLSEGVLANFGVGSAVGGIAQTGREALRIPIRRGGRASPAPESQPRIEPQEDAAAASTTQAPAQERITPAEIPPAPVTPSDPYGLERFAPAPELSEDGQTDVLAPSVPETETPAQSESLGRIAAMADRPSDTGTGEFVLPPDVLEYLRETNPELAGRYGSVEPSAGSEVGAVTGPSTTAVPTLSERLAKVLPAPEVAVDPAIEADVEANLAGYGADIEAFYNDNGLTWDLGGDAVRAVARHMVRDSLTAEEALERYAVEVYETERQARGQPETILGTSPPTAQAQAGTGAAPAGRSDGDARGARPDGQRDAQLGADRTRPARTAAAEPTGGAERSAEPAADTKPSTSQREFFSRLLKQKKPLKWSEVQSRLRASPEQMEMLRQDALNDGLLRQDRHGVYRRTAKVRADAEAGMPSLNANPNVLSIPADVRMDNAIRIREAQTGKRVSPVVRVLAIRLLARMGRPQFSTILAEAKKDAGLKVADVRDLAALVGYPPTAKSTKAEAFRLIAARHLDQKGFLERQARSQQMAAFLPGASLEEREAAARAFMESDEWKAAGEPLADASLYTKAGPDRRYLAEDGSEIAGAEAAAQYLADQAEAAVPGGVAQERKVFLVIGYPGSGKSTIARALSKEFRAAHMVSDIPKAIIPEYEGGKGGEIVDRESSELAKAATDIMVAKGDNIIIETLGSWPKVAKRAGYFLGQGYEPSLIFIDTPKAVAMERAVERYERGKATGSARAVPAFTFDLNPQEAYDNAIAYEAVTEHTRISPAEDEQGWRTLEASGRFGSAFQATLDAESRTRSVSGADGRLDGSPGQSENLAAFQPRPYSQIFQSRLPEVASAIQRELERMVPQDVPVRMMDRLMVGPAEALERVQIQPGGALLLDVSMAQGPDTAKIKGFHGVTHVLRESGLWSDAEWNLLVERANKTDAAERLNTPMVYEGRTIPMIEGYRTFYTQQARRLGFTEAEVAAQVEEQINQELVAALAESWAEGTSYGKQIDTLLDRILKFFQAVRNALNGLGFQTADDVFAKVVSGEVARRAEGGRREPTFDPFPNKPSPEEYHLSTEEGMAALDLLMGTASAEAMFAFSDWNPLRGLRERLSGRGQPGDDDFQASPFRYAAARIWNTIPNDPSEVREYPEEAARQLRNFRENIPNADQFHREHKITKIVMRDVERYADTVARQLDVYHANFPDIAAEFNMRPVTPIATLKDQWRYRLEGLINRPSDEEINAQLESLIQDAESGELGAWMASVDRESVASWLQTRADVAGYTAEQAYPAYRGDWLADRETEPLGAAEFARHYNALRGGQTLAAFSPAPESRSFPLNLPGFNGSVEESVKASGERIRKYFVNVDIAVTATESDPAPLQRLQSFIVSEQADGSWELSFFKGSENVQQVVAAIESDIGNRLSPRGWLTPQGYKYWQSTDPQSVRFHQNAGDVFGGMYASPRAVEFGIALRGRASVRDGSVVDPGPVSQRAMPTDADRLAFTQAQGWAGVNFEPDLSLREIKKGEPTGSQGQVAIIDPSVVRIIRNGDALRPGEFRAYHGTNVSFDKIDPSKFQTFESSGDLTGSGFYATLSRTVAEGIAESRVRGLGGKPTVIALAIDGARVPIVNYESFENSLQHWLAARGGGDQSVKSGTPEMSALSKLKSSLPPEALSSERNEQMFAFSGKDLDKPHSTVLPTDQASRLARAREQGFDTSKVWYHGTPHGGFGAFEISAERSSGMNNGVEGISVSELPEVANQYTGTWLSRELRPSRKQSLPVRLGLAPPRMEMTMVGRELRGGGIPGGQGTVYPLFLRVKKPFIWNLDDFERSESPDTIKRVKKLMPEYSESGDFPVETRGEFARALIQAGYDALDVVTHGKIEERVVFDPSNIRSVNAAFDPSEDGSPVLMAAFSSDDNRTPPYLAPPGQRETLRLTHEGVISESYPSTKRSRLRDAAFEFSGEPGLGLHLQARLLAKSPPKHEAPAGPVERVSIMRGDDDVGYVNYIVTTKKKPNDTAYIAFFSHYEPQLGRGAPPLSLRELKEIREEFRRIHPTVTRFEGERVSGAKRNAKDNFQSVMLAAFSSGDDRIPPYLSPPGQVAQPASPTGGNQGEVRGLADIIADLKDTLGLTTTQGRYGLTVVDQAGNRRWRFRAQPNVRGQYDRMGGVARIKIATDIDAIAHEGGHHLERVYGAELDALKQAHAEELGTRPAPNAPLPPMSTTGFSGLDLDADTQSVLVEASTAMREWRSLAAARTSAKAGKVFGRGNDTAVQEAAARAATATGTLERRLGTTIAQALIADILGDARIGTIIGQSPLRQAVTVGGSTHLEIAPTDMPAYVAERYSRNGVPSPRNVPTPTPLQISEGFAEFFRRYITDPDTVRRELPGVYTAFEDFLDAADPALLENLEKLQLTALSADYKAYRNATAVDRGVADVATMQPETVWEQVKDWYKSDNRRDRLKQWISLLGSNASFQLIDRTNPILKTQQALLRLADANGVRDADGRPISLEAGENAHRIARMMAGADKIGHQFITNGIPDYQGLEPVGPSLHNALVEAFGGTSAFRWSDQAMRRFGLYLEARRAIAEWPRYQAGEIPSPPTRRSFEENWQIIQDLEKSNPSYKSAAQKVYDWQHRLLTLEYQAGRWNKEEYEALSKRKNFYVPLFRDLSDLVPTTGAPPGSQLAKRFTEGHKFQGSQRDVINPVESLVRRAYATAAAIQFNDMVKALTNLSERSGPGGAGFIERVQKEEVLEANERTFERIKQAAITNGIDPADAHLIVDQMQMDFSDANVHLLWDPDNLGPNRPPIVPLFENGERKLVRLNDPIMGRRLFDAMNAIGREQTNIWIKAIAYPAAVLRAGVTMHPAFIISNILADMQSAYVLTGATPVLTQAKGLYALASTNPTVNRALRAVGITPPAIAQLYAAVGGIGGGQNTAALRALNREYDLGSLRQKGYHVLNVPATAGMLTTIVGGVAGGMVGGVVGATLGASVGAMAARAVLGHGTERAFVSLTEASETATRLGVASMVVKRIKKLYPNTSDVDAIREAGFAATDVIDFNRSGAKAGTLLKIIPFLGANIQGVSKAYRQSLMLDGERGRINMQKAGLFLRWQLTGTGGAQMRAQLSPREQQAVRDGARAWVNMMILAAIGVSLALLFKDDPEYDDVRSEVRNTHFVFKLWGTWFRVKKPFELAHPANMAEAYYEWMFRNDPRLMERIAKSFRETHTPPVVPQTLNLITGWRTGIDPRTQRPIVHEGLSRLPAPQQYGAYSSAFAIGWAQALEKVGVKISPMVIDWTLNNELAYWGREVRVTSDYFFSNRAPQWTDVPVTGTMLNRFTVDPSRSSASVEEFWKIMGRGRGDFDQAAAGYDNLLRGGNPGAVRAYLAGLSPEERTYAVLQKHFSTADKAAHPLNRANSIYRLNAAMRREMADKGLISTEAGERGTTIDMAPAMRAQVDNILGRLAAVEAWNALHDVGRPGWAAREVRDPQPVLDELRAASVPAYEEMMRRRRQDKVADYPDARERWADVNTRINEMIVDDDLLGLAWDKSFRRRRGAMRRMEENSGPRVPIVPQPGPSQIPAPY